MTDRHTVDTITSDALDALYEQLEAAEATETQRQLAVAREALASATLRAARAEAEIAACRKQQWPQQLARAEEVIARVRELRDSWLLMTLEPGQVRRLLDGITHALDGEQPAPTATQTTETPKEK